jgi:hypothetical protein
VSRRLAALGDYRRYLFGVLLLLPAVRALTWWRLTGSLAHHDSTLFLERLYTPFHLHCDALVMGLILGNLAVTGDGEGSRFWSSGWILPAAAIACGVLMLVQREVFDFTGITLLFGACVRYAVSPRRLRLAFLDSRVFYVISRLSFGMYLNHRYLEDFTVSFCLRHVPFAERAPGIHFLVTYVVFVVLSTLAATVTFCLVEHPFLALRGALLDRPRARAAA